MGHLLGFMLMLAVTPLAAVAGDEDGRLMSRLQALLQGVAARSESVPRLVVTGAEVEIGPQRLRITRVSEQALHTQGEFMSAAHFEIALNGEPQDRLTVGSIGIGDTADDATDTVVGEWYVTFGSALFRSIGDGPPDLTFGRFRVYAGHLGGRGQAPDALVAGQVITPESLLSAISGALPRVDGKLHSLHIIVVIVAGGATAGECRVDGQVSPTALALVQTLRWPTGATHYMYKQSYVLR